MGFLCHTMPLDFIDGGKSCEEPENHINIFQDQFARRVGLPSPSQKSHPTLINFCMIMDLVDWFEYLPTLSNTNTSSKNVWHTIKCN